jgi:CPA1 family monovalent cation:H+ antiporter
MIVLEILSVLFIAAAIFGLIAARWLKLPITIGTMLLTVIASAALMLTAGFVPHLHRDAQALLNHVDFGSVVLHGMLPLLLFAGAFLLELEPLRREKLTVALLSTIGTGLSFILVALLMLLLSGGHIPWIECLIFGALVSPTDPIAVLELLRSIGIPPRIEAQLAGESLFNDGLGAVLFITILESAAGQAPTPLAVAGELIAKAGGGIVLGIAAAWVTSHLMRRVNSYQVDILFTAALALGGYALADALHLSAPLEAVVAGIALRQFNCGLPDLQVAHANVDGFWKVIDEIQNSILFVLMGFEAMSIPLDAMTWRAGLAAIVSVNAVRFAVVAGLLALVRTIHRGHRSSTFVLAWGGLRGGLSIALALSVPDALGRSWILGATYILVVFSIVVQGSSMAWLSRSRRMANAA